LSLGALRAADASPDLLGERGLPRILFKNDSDDLKLADYPVHHADGVWAFDLEYPDYSSVIFV
jgi:hypothetical protein